MPFTWVPFYKELASKLAAYRTNSGELAQLLTSVLQQQGLETDWLRDKDEQGQFHALTEIDPFTFFAAFNRGISKDNRSGILQNLRGSFALTTVLPDDFNGIPTLDNRNSWFVSYRPDRATDDIENLWQLFTECINKQASEISAKFYEAATKVAGVGKLTIGLFWVNPEEYVGLDGVMCPHLADKIAAGDLSVKAKTLQGYVSVLQEIRTRFPGKKFYEISYEAWTIKQSTVPHWIMALGEKSEFWDDCHTRQIIRIGWDSLRRNLSGLDRKQLASEYQTAYGNTDDLKGITDFACGMKPGDKVFIKRGRRELIGLAEITGDCSYDASLATYRHSRPVRWLNTGSWVLPENMKTLPVKTLTPANDLKQIQDLTRLMGSGGSGGTPPPEVLRQRVLPSLNVILYGPPGTGKTWSLLNEYARLFIDQSAPLSDDDRADFAVAGLTWWEAIAIVMMDIHRGSVSSILEHPIMQAKTRTSQSKHPRAAIWAHLQTHTDPKCPNVNYAQRSEPYLFEKSAESVWSIKEDVARKETPELVEKLSAFKSGGVPNAPEPRYETVTFHQSYSYEDFVEGIKPVLDQVAESGSVAYELVPGIFKRLVLKAQRNPDKRYALFIDEINRGNVASIFGELISLIEDDKRKDAEHEMSVRLPYSHEEFSVPPNLYIIGTMNTADRSVEALDTALRRRFTFVEKAPDPGLLKKAASLEVDLKRLLLTINSRIERLLDRDHCIGHSFLMEVAAAQEPLSELRGAFKHKILPLLREYFYGNPAKIGMVLGERFVRRRPQNDMSFASGAWGIDEIETKEVFELLDPESLSPEDFASIYEQPSTGV